MPAQPNRSFDPAALAQLACPACQGDLHLHGANPEAPRLVCVTCARAYPVVDGIPVLIVDRAEKPTNQPSAR